MLISPRYTMTACLLELKRDLKKKELQKKKKKLLQSVKTVRFIIEYRFIDVLAQWGTFTESRIMND